MKLLKIAILSQIDSPTITEQLAPLLRKRGHTVDILDLSSVPEEDFLSHAEIQSLLNYDVVYYRSGLDANGSQGRIVQLETLLRNSSVKTVNLHYTEHPLAHSKSYETQQAERNGLTVPKSVYSTAQNFSTLSEQLNVPFITKTEYGTNGNGVHLVNTAEDFISIQNLYPNKRLLHQAFVPHDFEYRIHIMDGKTVCIWKKAPSDGDFRSNEAQGGEMLTADPKHTKELTQLAKITFAAFDFDIFVADFMLDKNTGEFYFTEVNLNPGWGETDRVATGIDVIGLTADYFEKICT